MYYCVFISLYYSQQSSVQHSCTTAFITPSTVLSTFHEVMYFFITHSTVPPTFPKVLYFYYFQHNSSHFSWNAVLFYYSQHSCSHFSWNSILLLLPAQFLPLFIKFYNFITPSTVPPTFHEVLYFFITLSTVPPTFQDVFAVASIRLIMVEGVTIVMVRWCDEWQTSWYVMPDYFPSLPHITTHASVSIQGSHTGLSIKFPHFFLTFYRLHSNFSWLMNNKT